MSQPTGVGDLTGDGRAFSHDGHPDLMAVDFPTGDLYLYPGKTGGFLPRIRLSNGWTYRGPLA